MYMRTRWAVARIAKDFAIGLAIFMGIAAVTMADALAQTFVMGPAAPANGMHVLHTLPRLMALAVAFSAMLAFGLWFYRHMTGSTVKTRRPARRAQPRRAQSPRRRPID